ncbi:hypothetical protein AMTRI_Chr01g128850 [Amborella trichopoda]
MADSSRAEKNSQTMDPSMLASHVLPSVIVGFPADPLSGDPIIIFVPLSPLSPTPVILPNLIPLPTPPSPIPFLDPFAANLPPNFSNPLFSALVGEPSSLTTFSPLPPFPVIPTCSPTFGLTPPSVPTPHSPHLSPSPSSLHRNNVPHLTIMFSLLGRSLLPRCHHLLLWGFLLLRLPSLWLNQVPLQ